MKFRELYKKEIAPKLVAKFGYKSILAVPKLTKITINVGVGRNTKDKQYIENVVKDVEVMAGQKPVMTKAKKSISAFKVRQGDIVGVSVTLRGDKMFDFMEKLVRITFPRVRDFRGISEKNVDSNGNLTVGFKEHTSFAEIKLEQVDKVHGLEVSLTTNARSKEAGLELWRAFGIPFKKD